MGYADIKKRKMAEPATGCCGYGLVNPSSGDVYKVWVALLSVCGIAGMLILFYSLAMYLSFGRVEVWVCVGGILLVVSIGGTVVCSMIKAKIEKRLAEIRDKEYEERRAKEKVERERERILREEERRKAEEREANRREAEHRLIVRRFYDWVDALGGVDQVVCKPIDVEIPCKRGESYYYTTDAACGEGGFGVMYISNRRLNFVGDEKNLVIMVSEITDLDVPYSDEEIIVGTTKRSSKYHFRVKNPYACKTVLCGVMGRSVEVPQRLSS